MGKRMEYRLQHQRPTLVGGQLQKASGTVRREGVLTAVADCMEGNVVLGVQMGKDIEKEVGVRLYHALIEVAGTGGLGKGYSRQQPRLEVPAGDTAGPMEFVRRGRILQVGGQGPTATTSLFQKETQITDGFSS